MVDQRLKIDRSTRQYKKNVATLPDSKKIHFGDSRYQQREDQTPLKAFKSADHGDLKRRDAYYSRHVKDAPQYSAKLVQSQLTSGNRAGAAGKVGGPRAEPCG